MRRDSDSYNPLSSNHWTNSFQSFVKFFSFAELFHFILINRFIAGVSRIALIIKIKVHWLLKCNSLINSQFVSSFFIPLASLVSFPKRMELINSNKKKVINGVKLKGIATAITHSHSLRESISLHNNSFRSALAARFIFVVCFVHFIACEWNGRNNKTNIITVDRLHRN